MLRLHRPVAPTPTSAAVARARLSQALGADRARIVAVSELRSRTLGTTPGAEPPEQVLGRLLAEPLATRSQV